MIRNRMSLPSDSRTKLGEKTKEIRARGFVVFEGKNLSENAASEKLFLQILEKRIRKKIRGFKAMGIRLKSFNIIID